MLLSNFGHRRQQRESDCLVACADMVLHHLGLSINYPRLARLLRAGPSSTPFGNLRYLEQLRLSVTLGEQGDLALFEPYLEAGLPVIVGVKTLAWPHWGGEVTRHAVVVVGIDQEHGVIYVHDPFFAESPIEMDLLAFEMGWEELERHYAVIGLASPVVQSQSRP
jgi:ABC-type bacteriocin/lantibiotic exporter with double-glycine peptidase domain